MTPFDSTNCQHFFWPGDYTNGVQTKWFQRLFVMFFDPLFSKLIIAAIYQSHFFIKIESGCLAHNRLSFFVIKNFGKKYISDYTTIRTHFLWPLSKGDVKRQWKSAMKKYPPAPAPADMNLLPQQSNHFINNNQHHLANSIHGVLKKPPNYQDTYGEIREEDEDFLSQSSYGSHKNRDFRSGSHGGSQDEENFPAVYTREPRLYYICWLCENFTLPRAQTFALPRFLKVHRAARGKDSLLVYIIFYISSLVKLCSDYFNWKSTVIKELKYFSNYSKYDKNTTVLTSRFRTELN